MAAASSSFSSIALPIAAVVATLVAGVVGAWAVYAVGLPRRRLLYGLTMVASVLPGGHEMLGDLKLRRDDGTVLDHPKLLRVQLLGRGSRDVPSSSFDSGKPIEMDVAVPIVTVIQVTSEPKSLLAPKTDFDGTILKVGPSLIGKKQRVTFTLLVDGENPELSCHAALENVKVQSLRLYQVPPRRVLFPLGATLALGFTSLGFGLVWATIGTGLVSVAATTPHSAASVAF